MARKKVVKKTTEEQPKKANTNKTETKATVATNKVEPKAKSKKEEKEENKNVEVKPQTIDKIEIVNDFEPDAPEPENPNPRAAVEDPIPTLIVNVSGNDLTYTKVDKLTDVQADAISRALFALKGRFGLGTEYTVTIREK